MELHWQMLKFLTCTAVINDRVVLEIGWTKELPKA
jgi:hypothetical protein